MDLVGDSYRRQLMKMFYSLYHIECCASVLHTIMVCETKTPFCTETEHVQKKIKKYLHPVWIVLPNFCFASVLSESFSPGTGPENITAVSILFAWLMPNARRSHSKSWPINVVEGFSQVFNSRWISGNVFLAHRTCSDVIPWYLWIRQKYQRSTTLMFLCTN